ncbi:hypothetical protein, partial [Thiococcus pfennigii]|uniref:hypothetical protein n=1 Tax=Thiococcus pfennigii TaxID=1057 RepID=UPI001A91921D
LVYPSPSSLALFVAAAARERLSGRAGPATVREIVGATPRLGRRDRHGEGGGGNEEGETGR